MKFQERICEELKNCAFTQKQLAEALGVDPANITNWKTGKNMPSVEILYQLCKVLNVSSDYLLGLDEELKKW